jgi:hypothetical protein
MESEVLKSDTDLCHESLEAFLHLRLRFSGFRFSRGITTKCFHFAMICAQYHAISLDLILLNNIKFKEGKLLSFQWLNLLSTGLRENLQITTLILLLLCLIVRYYVLVETSINLM